MKKNLGGQLLYNRVSRVMSVRPRELYIRPPPPPPARWSTWIWHIATIHSVWTRQEATESQSMSQLFNCECCQITFPLAQIHSSRTPLPLEHTFPSGRQGGKDRERGGGGGDLAI